MKFFILSLFCMALFLASATATKQKTTEMILSRRAEGSAAPEHGQHGSTNTTATSTSTATTPAKAKGNPVIWASPAILQDGTLFYIAISISTLLWCTGKAVDMSLDQQERRAEFLARR